MGLITLEIGRHLSFFYDSPGKAQEKPLIKIDVCPCPAMSGRLPSPSEMKLSVPMNCRQPSRQVFHTVFKPILTTRIRTVILNKGKPGKAGGTRHT